MASTVAGYIGRINPGNGTQYSLGSTAYGVCSTAASTATKTVEMTGFELIPGATVFIKFTNANTAASPVLNVNQTGDKPIVQYGTTVAGTTNSTTGWYAGAVLCLTYDGTSWVRDQGFNTNTTYSTMSQTEAWTGTAESSRVVTAALFKSYFNKLAGSGLSLATWNTDNGIKLNHTNSVTAKTSYGSNATTASANGGKIVVTDIQYDAQGHITASTDREITLSQKTYTLSGLGGIGTVNASGTEPLTLSASKSGTTVTISGSIATVSASSAGVAPKGAAVSSQNQTTKFLREDGTWAVPSYTTLTNLNASNISSGTVAFARLPSMYWANTAVANTASYKTTPEVANIKINGNTSASAASTKNVQLTYDSTLEVLNFVFS